ncbi:uncharacterized protein [Blastocystis hominis]|uniref:Bicarbonate transporter-like transmembrane domain-containing protein n=1 Tax=Blastocystis hominis TaxID=12968 RepID=D8M1Y8_BLAHO|nr:uncharacterized protein [Blastocystis hominis]XP_012896545.1 uncharacterized protein [Blastocystis hominis]CBK22077.2 unnamed protein product [Blastocystis hominis]CBK22497.2 unnamed protein product [Blastocystis hominis]|eukprot:XP_012896125.1 uncharacterized protein [Blastocystis hominis]
MMGYVKCSYTQAFLQNNITVSLLPDINEEYMDKLGIYAKSRDEDTIRQELRKEDNRKQNCIDTSVVEELEHVQMSSATRPLSVSSEHGFIHNDQNSLLDDDEDDRYGSSYLSEVESRSPSFDLQRSSQYSSTINSIVLHYKSHGGVTPNSKQDNDSIHSSNYTKSVSSQGELNRIIAANSYVSEVLEGDVEEQPHPLNLVPNNWSSQEEMYSRAHPEDAEDLHVICDLLNSGLILLEEESNGKSLVQILEGIITKYNKQKGVDSGLDARRLASDKGLVYLNGFLLIESVRESQVFNDVLFARLTQRSVIPEQDYQQLKSSFTISSIPRFVFIISSDASHSLWSHNLFTLLSKVVTDQSLYSDLFLAKSRADVIHALADMAVRIQRRVSVESLKKHPKGKEKKKGLFCGLKKDVATRSRYYWSDFGDGYTVNTILKTFLIFISQLGPTLIFAVLIHKYSHGNIGTVETLLGQSITSIIWAFLGGQPMILMGLTGPIAIFVGVLYDLSV